MAEAAQGGLIGTLYVRLTAQTSDLNKKVDDAEKKVVKSTDAMGKSVMGLKTLITSLAGAFAAWRAIDFVQGVVNSTDELKKFSQELGISLNNLAALKYAADKSNIGEQFQSGMRKFSESLREAQVEGSNMQDLFQNVLKVDPAQGVDEALKAVMDRFAGYRDGIEKTGMAQELFGTRNARFVNLLSQGSKGLKRETEELAKVMGMSYEDAAKASEEYNDSLTTLKASFTGIAMAFIRDFLPMLTEFNKKLALEYIPYIKDALAANEGWAASLVKVGKGLKSFSDTIQGNNNVFVSFWESSFGTWLSDGIQGMQDYAKEYRRMQRAVGGGYAGMTSVPSRASLMNSGRVSGAGLIGMPKGLSFDMNQMLNGGISPGPTPVAAELFGPEVPQNLEARKAQRALMDQFMAGTKGTASGLKTEIAGLSGIEGLAEATKLEEEKNAIDQHLKDLRKLREDHLKHVGALTEEQEARITEIERLNAEKRHAIAIAEMTMRLQVGQQMFTDLSSIAKAWAGEQSAIYKAMFAASKAFAIAEATVKIAQGIAAAAANPWPMNLFAMASVVAATASIVSSIQAVQLEFGGERALGGDVSPDKAFLVGEKGPEMFVPSGRGSIVPNNRLGGPTKIIVNNYADVRPEITESQEGNERILKMVIQRTKNEVAADFRQGDGPISKSLESSFTVRRRGR